MLPACPSGFPHALVMWKLCVLPGLQWVSACKASMQRCGVERLALAQLHWSTANYAPLQERLMWDGLVAIYEEVGWCWPAGTAASRGGQGDR